MYKAETRTKEATDFLVQALGARLASAAMSTQIGEIAKSGNLHAAFTFGFTFRGADYNVEVSASTLGPAELDEYNNWRERAPY